MSYQVTSGAHVLRVEDGALIPPDAGNADYQELLAWQADGGVIEPAPVPSLGAARAARDAELAAACSAAITAGITLDVTGEALFYPTSPQDQANLNGVVTVALLGVPEGWTQGLTTGDAAGVWARRPHTAAQTQAVGRAVAAHVDACRARLADRRAALAAAGSYEEIGAVAW